MIETHELDSPIDRASLDKLPVDDMIAYIERIRERRLEPLRIYEAGLVAKEKAAKSKAAEDMKKRLDQFAKVNATVLNGLDKLMKYAQEIQGYRIVLGDDIWNEEK